jgi:photosystem II stability/assembly factor-like uncharacterized protein
MSSEEERTYFLKKRSKKLLDSYARASRPSAAQKCKSFLVLFFKKELLSSFLVLFLTGAADTDQPLWRAKHGVLLSVARAGERLVAVGDRGIVLLSDDQGQHWREVQSGTDELLTGVIFTTPKEGWAVGQDATIVHSTDAGATWQPQHAKPGGDTALFSIAAISANHLIATGAYALAFETQDGAQWTSVSLPSMDEDYHLNCVTARGDDVIITGEAGHAFLRHAGAWAAIPVGYDGSQFGCLTEPDGRVYSFGLRGSLFSLAPDQTKWQRIDTGVAQSFFGGANLADGRIALVGGNGFAALFDPASGVLTRLHSGTSASLSGVAEAADNMLIVVGDDGIHTIDPKNAEVTQ